MGQPKISPAVVVLWILFSIYYQENLGTLQADLGASCSRLSWTANSHTVNHFSCCISHVETAPLFCAANGDGGSFSLDIPPQTRSLQAGRSQAASNSLVLVCRKASAAQDGLYRDRQAACPLLHWHIFANHSDIFLPRVIVCLCVMATEKFLGGTVFYWCNRHNVGDLRWLSIEMEY